MKKPLFVAVILSAGKGERLGGLCKGLLRLKGQPLIAHQARVALEAGAAHVFVVTGFMQEKIEAALTGLEHVSTVRVDSQAPIQESARRGLHTAHAAHPRHAVALTLADLPLMTPQHFRVLIDLLQEHPEADAALARNANGQPGHPVVLSAHWLDELPLGEPGFQLKAALAEQKTHVLFHATHDPAHFTDIDTPDDLQNMQNRFGLAIEKPAN